jgi:Transmembrane Fragile-X-F protein
MRGQRPIQLPGFYLAGLLSVGLAVLKLTTEGHWSWWRVFLPLWVILGHNSLYILVGFVWLSFLDHGDAEESLTIRPNLRKVTNMRQCCVSSCSPTTCSDESKGRISAYGFG